MEKKIEHYLPFYIDAIEVQCPKQIGWKHSQKRHPLTLSFLYEHRDKKLIPILRPLSSMTEEEMKELYAFVFKKRTFVGDNITHRDIGTKEERWVLWSGLERLFIYKDGDVGADIDLHHFRVNHPEVVRWQLSKGFDIFNLEASGLAIYEMPESKLHYIIGHETIHESQAETKDKLETLQDFTDAAKRLHKAVAKLEPEPEESQNEKEWERFWYRFGENDFDIRNAHKYYIIQRKKQ